MTTPNASRRGFTLIELLCIMVLLALLMTVLTVLFRDTLRVERIQSAGFDRILQCKVLADQFRADVARAEKVDEEWNDFQGDANTLILRMKANGHVVYRWHDGKLARHVFAEGEEEKHSTLPIGGKQAEVEFIHADKQGIVRLRLHALRDQKREPGNALEIAAALGGDWR